MQEIQQYFAYELKRGPDISVQHKVCLPVVKTLSASKYFVSNLKEHLQANSLNQVHPSP